MQIIESVSKWRALRANFPENIKIGFVPTMGNLHQGHLSLCEKSLSENDITIVSIFVNPTQFNQPEDFQHYPRTIEADLSLLKQHGIQYCLLPEANEIYADHYQYKIEAVLPTICCEHQYRPGHFSGVLTVVMKLLMLVMPHRAYFGEKDYQQYELIRDMVAAFFMPISIKPCPTIRDLSGLPFSSRNNRLSVEERQQADEFARIFAQKTSLETIRSELVAKNIRVEYLEIYQKRKFIAVHIGPVRLIDNREI